MRSNQPASQPASSQPATSRQTAAGTVRGLLPHDNKSEPLPCHALLYMCTIGTSTLTYSSQKSTYNSKPDRRQQAAMSSRRWPTGIVHLNPIATTPEGSSHSAHHCPPTSKEDSGACEARESSSSSSSSSFHSPGSQMRIVKKQKSYLLIYTSTFFNPRSSVALCTARRSTFDNFHQSPVSRGICKQLPSIYLRDI